MACGGLLNACYFHVADYLAVLLHMMDDHRTLKKTLRKSPLEVPTSGYDGIVHDAIGANS